MRGWVYVISNPVIPGLVKIGFSTKDPVLRAEELNHTGSPDKFVVEYDVLVENPYQVEQQVHQMLIDCRYRDDREFFSCAPETAIMAIRNICQGKILHENCSWVDLNKIKEKKQQLENEKLRKIIADAEQKAKNNMERFAQKEAKMLQIKKEYEDYLKSFNRKKISHSTDGITISLKRFQTFEEYTRDHETNKISCMVDLTRYQKEKPIDIEIPSYFRSLDKDKKGSFKNILILFSIVGIIILFTVFFVKAG